MVAGVRAPSAAVWGPIRVLSTSAGSFRPAGPGYVNFLPSCSVRDARQQWVITVVLVACFAHVKP